MIGPGLAHELKAAGFPQPDPAYGQVWYGGDIPFFIEGEFRHNFKEMAFAPSLDDISRLLPEGFALEIWEGRPSCANRDGGFPLRTFGWTFAEAAANMYLEAKKAPGHLPTPGE